MWGTWNYKVYMWGYLECMCGGTGGTLAGAKAGQHLGKGGKVSGCKNLFNSRNVYKLNDDYYGLKKNTAY